ncbi:MAG: hypothetical protein ACPLXS_02235, partial [Candidatus Micrarchaeales archaeon]
MIPQLFAFVIGFLLSFICGFPFTYFILRKKASKLEISVYSLLLGISFPAIFSFLESYLISFSQVFYFSLPLAIFNNFLFFAIGLALLLYKKISLNELKEFFELKLSISLSGLFPIFVLALLAFVFYENILGLGIAPKYYEFDPYFYMFTTQYLFAYGFIPKYDISAWPGKVTSHATTPLLPYITAFWTELYMFLSNSSYSNNLLAYVASVYPPLSACFLTFAIIEILAHLYNKKIGLLGGFIVATMPIIVLSFSPGHAQEQPWGVMGVYLFIASYLLAAKEKTKKLGIFAGMIYGITLLGSKYFLVTALIAPAFMILYSTFEFFFGKEENIKKFNIMNAFMCLTIAIFYAIYLPYASYTKVVQVVFGFIPVTLVIILFGLFYSFTLQLYTRTKLKKEENQTLAKLIYFSSIAFVFTLLILVSPIGKYVLGYIFFTASFAKPKIPLYMTVAEYAWSGFTFNFSQVFGLIALHLPYNFFVVLILLSSFIAIFVRGALGKRE